jgi:hypothetical protein
MTSDGDKGVLCALCGERMGVYEPLIALAPGQHGVRTSRLLQRDRPVDGLLVHEECFASRRPRGGEPSD